MPRSNQYNVYRWLYFSVNALGDPEMPIYIDEPKRFENVTFSFQNNSLLVNTGLDSCRICVTSAADNGASYYQVWNQVSSTSFPIPSDSCVICVTKTGYSPYIVKYLAHDTEYIQNETIAGDTVVIAKNVFVGSDVTTSRPQGPVTVSSGKTRIFGEDITLKNNFTVVNGAELYIGN